jgi:hypothetical protein
MSTQNETPAGQEVIQLATSAYDAFAPEGASASAASGAQFGAALGRQIAKAAVWVLSFLTLSVEILLRRNFGQRYLTPFRCFMIACGMGAWFTLVSAASVFGTRNAFVLANLIGMAGLAYLAVLGAMAYHLREIHLRKRNKVRLHSRYAGDSWSGWTRLPFYDAIGGQMGVQYYFEPGLLCTAGLAAMTAPFSGPIGVWLWYSGIALAIKGAIQRSNVEGQVLDMIDRQIESEVLNALVMEWKDTGSNTTWGYVVPYSMKAASQSDRIAFAASNTKLDPKLRELIGETPSLGSPRA